MFGYGKFPSTIKTIRSAEDVLPQAL